ncbi:MAG: hypothetical protein R3C55_12325 [Parvularculaceae bacterium]
MGSAVALFGDASAGGPAQIVLLVAAASASIIGVANGMSWSELEEATVHAIARAVPASLILLAVGALIGTWMMSGHDAGDDLLRARASQSVLLSGGDAHLRGRQFRSAFLRRRVQSALLWSASPR